MIDEYSLDGTGWARFSPDRLKRYRLGRLIRPHLLAYGWQNLPRTANRVVFVLLNPSDADAFKPDRTVSKCCQFADRWGADVLEVVNLFAFRSPYPRELRRAFDRGSGPENDQQIIEACTQPGVSRVVAGWGNGGDLDERDVEVCKLLDGRVPLWHLGLTGDGVTGSPLHPLARGKAFIPLDRELEVWA